MEQRCLADATWPEDVQHAEGCFLRFERRSKKSLLVGTPHEQTLPRRVQSIRQTRLNLSPLMTFAFGGFIMWR